MFVNILYFLSHPDQNLFCPFISLLSGYYILFHRYEFKKRQMTGRIDLNIPQTTVQTIVLMVLPSYCCSSEVNKPLNSKQYLPGPRLRYYERQVQGFYICPLVSFSRICFRPLCLVTTSEQKPSLLESVAKPSRQFSYSPMQTLPFSKPVKTINF